MRAVVDNPDGLLVPGIFVRVRIPRRLPESVLVPESALQRDLTGYYVFTVDESRQVSRADVETGPPVKTYRSIQSGLTGDAEVIIKGLQRIQPGLVVDTKMVTLSAIEQPGVGSDSSDPAGE
jgi:multidrug efflux pump subunit AcrA (membrane-fusion protein)